MSKAEQEFMNCPTCFIYWSAPAALFEARRKDGATFYCPNGHNLSWTDNEHDRTRRERDRLKQQTARLEEEKRMALATASEQFALRKAAEARANGYRGAAAKLKKRVSNGVCPCCNRSFGDLAAHMATKHAGFMAEEIAA